MCDKDKYYLEHREDELINQRLGWLLTTQSILLAGYGLLIRSKLGRTTDVYDKEIENIFSHLIKLFPYVGISIATLALIGVIGAIISFYTNQAKRRNASDPKESKERKLWVSEVLGSTPAIGFPVLFLIVWLIVLH